MINRKKIALGVELTISQYIYIYRLVMHVNHAHHALLKIQYDHASNLGI